VGRLLYQNNGANIMSEYYTDYPFTELGDIPYEEAPIRRIEIISYDNNKYCKIALPCGKISSVKAGYIYKNESRYGQAIFITQDELQNFVRK